MTDDLTTWLRAQLDDDERVALGVDGLSDDTIGDIALMAGSGAVEFLRHFHLDRVLAEVDAKRRILEEHPTTPAYYALLEHCARCVDPEAGGPDPDAEYPCKTVRLLALPYADRPGYRDEWRPAS